MGFHDRYHVDKAAEEEGTWLPLGDDFWLKVRRPTSAHAKATRRKLEEPHKALTKTGQDLPDDILEDIATKQMAQSLIIDWKGKGSPHTDDGKPIPATPETIEKVLVDYPDFRIEVFQLLTERSTFKKQVRDAEVGNS